MIKKIERHPWLFVGAWTVPYFLFGVQFYRNQHTWLQVLIYIVLGLLFTYVQFNMNVDEVELNEALNREIEKTGLSKQQLWSYTGLNVYTMTPDEKEGYTFFMDKADKKRLLKKLKAYNQ
ncbi:hypothetical protein [Macrococcus brunensis]|uniref:hypothetical protein n=1 Tax=Macrococcus brunensis TaxID=198483 RepID=UPI001EF01E0B|nr:hypothetical protein [Macrococcus brunensis]ULG73883.1 hypothetical protein MGG13_09515 [Macrococcus brunensis]